MSWHFFIKLTPIQFEFCAKLFEIFSSFSILGKSEDPLFLHMARNNGPQILMMAIFFIKCTSFSWILFINCFKKIKVGPLWANVDPPFGHYGQQSGAPNDDWLYLQFQDVFHKDGMFEIE